jgi:hypothetical protein
MQAFGEAASGRVRVYLVGGTTAVLLGWRMTTIDVDFVMRPDDEGRGVRGAVAERVAYAVIRPNPFIPLPSGQTCRWGFPSGRSRSADNH